MKKNAIYAIIILGVLIVVATAISLNLEFNETELIPSTTPKPHIPQTTQLLIRITTEGEWNGTYADSPITAPLAIYINGSGNETITIDRPIDCVNQWVITAQAQKQNLNNDLLTLSILSLDGTILNSASTSTNQPVSVTAIIQD